MVWILEVLRIELLVEIGKESMMLCYRIELMIVKVKFKREYINKMEGM